MGHLQLELLATQNRKIFAPVELEGFARLEDQRHESPAPAGLMFRGGSGKLLAVRAAHIDTV